MPIVFAPAEPIRPDISTGYGASQQWTQDAPMLQRQQQGIAEAYLQSAAMQQRAAQASQQMQLQAHEHMAGLDQQQANQQAHFTLAQQQMGHQSDMQSQHANLQDQLAANQLTRSETMRLERMRNAQADIMANPDLSDEDKHNAVMLLRTGIDSYTQRQHRAQQAGTELHNQQMQRQTAQFDRLTAERERYQSQGAQDHMEVVTDPNTGEDYTFHRGEDGRRTFIGSRGTGSAVWHPGQVIEGGGSGIARSRAGAGGGSQPTEGEQAFDPRIHSAALHEAQALAGRDDLGHQRAPTQQQIDAAYARMAGMGQQQGPRGPSRQQITAEVWQTIQSNPAMASLPIAQQRLMRDREVARLMAAAQVPIEERRQANAEVDRTVAAAPEWARQMVSNPADRARMQGRALQGLRERAATTTTLPPQPFNPEQPESLTQQQREALSVFDQAEQRIATLPEGRRADLMHNVQRLRSLLAEYGSTERMPPHALRRFNELRRPLDRIPLQAPAARPAERNLGDVWNDATAGTILENEYSNRR